MLQKRRYFPPSQVERATAAPGAVSPHARAAPGRSSSATAAATDPVRTAVKGEL